MFKFNSLKSAQSFADKAIKPQAIILGDDNLFWVVSLREGQKLVKQGYEVA